MSENFYCAKCGGFIEWDFSWWLATSPPKHKGKCTDCGEIVYQFAHKIKKEKDCDDMMCERLRAINLSTTNEAADLIEHQQARISELEQRAEEAEGKLSVVLDKHSQPDSYKCVVYDLTPLEAEKKVQDGITRLGWLPPDEATALRQERDELAATVERLREDLKSILGWRELRNTSTIPIERIEEVARIAIESIPQQSLAERDYKIAYNAFHAGVVYADTVPKGTGDTPGAANEYAKRIKEGE